MVLEKVKYRSQRVIKLNHNDFISKHLRTSDSCSQSCHVYILHLDSLASCIAAWDASVLHRIYAYTVIPVSPMAS